jgi:hypothetical protein
MAVGPNRAAIDSRAFTQGRGLDVISASFGREKRTAAVTAFDRSIGLLIMAAGASNNPICSFRQASMRNVLCRRGRDEETIRAYIKNQEIVDKQLDQLQLKLASS